MLPLRTIPPFAAFELLLMQTAVKYAITMLHVLLDEIVTLQLLAKSAITAVVSVKLVIVRFDSEIDNVLCSTTARVPSR